MQVTGKCQKRFFQWIPLQQPPLRRSGLQVVFIPILAIVLPGCITRPPSEGPLQVKIIGRQVVSKTYIDDSCGMCIIFLFGEHTVIMMPYTSIYAGPLWSVTMLRFLQGAAINVTKRLNHGHTRFGPLRNILSSTLTWTYWKCVTYVKCVFFQTFPPSSA